MIVHDSDSRSPACLRATETLSGACSLSYDAVRKSSAIVELSVKEENNCDCDCDDYDCDYDYEDCTELTPPMDVVVEKSSPIFELLAECTRAE